MTTPDIKMEPCKTRLTIREGMTVEEVKQKGNKAQAAAVCIFDEDGNGKFDAKEAELFNSRYISANDDTIKLYDKKTKKLIGTYDKKEAAAEYDKKVLEYAKLQEEAAKWQKEQEARKLEMEKREEKLTKQLAPYGIRPSAVSDMFDNAVEKNINGKKALVLTSKETGFELTLPLDQLKKPGEIYAFTGGEGGPEISGVTGTLRQTKTAEELKNADLDYYVGFSSVRIKDSDITFIGKYGSKDLVNLDKNARVVFETDDWADQVISDQKTSVQEPDISGYVAKNGFEYNEMQLRPGRYVFDTRKIEHKK